MQSPTTNREIVSAWYVSQMVAHSLVYFARERVGTLDLFCGGDPPAPTASESTAEMLKAYTQYLPDLLRVTSQNIMPMEEALLASRQAISPQQSQLEYDLYKQFGPQFAQIGADISRQNALSQAATDAAVLKGPGRDVVSSALEAQKLADPEYYKARELGLKGLENLFSNLPDAGTGLSGAEREEVTRSLARDNIARGNTTGGALSTVENAMKFGSAGAARQAQKQSQVAGAVGAAGGFMSPAQSRIDTFQMTTGKPSMNFGDSKFSGPRETGEATMGMGQGMWQGIGQLQSDAMNVNAKRRDTLDRLIAMNESNPDCCWIFLAAHGGELPWYVRHCRNVLGTSETRRGYKRMSRWLVPAMKRSGALRWIVRTVMTEPITMYGGYLCGVNRDGWVFRPVKRFWFAIWNKLGTH